MSLWEQIPQSKAFSSGVNHCVHKLSTQIESDDFRCLGKQLDKYLPGTGTSGRRCEADPFWFESSAFVEKPKPVLT
ncbi:hypothetical protein BT93_J1931 [Corymbia citriodora subsp. variegata]|nr:hypothetical protein BT93_J1931 [Corymbia citriodora subsp. variegata]